MTLILNCGNLLSSHYQQRMSINMNNLLYKCNMIRIKMLEGLPCMRELIRYPTMRQIEYSPSTWGHSHRYSFLNHYPKAQLITLYWRDNRVQNSKSSLNHSQLPVQNLSWTKQSFTILLEQVSKIKMTWISHSQSITPKSKWFYPYLWTWIHSEAMESSRSTIVINWPISTFPISMENLER